MHDCQFVYHVVKEFWEQKWDYKKFPISCPTVVKGIDNRECKCITVLILDALNIVSLHLDVSFMFLIPIPLSL